MTNLEKSIMTNLEKLIMTNNRERLTIVDECKHFFLIVLLECKIMTLQEHIHTTNDFFMRDIYTNDIKELTQILLKLK